MNRINIICLGVRDMQKSIIFYRDGLGFQTEEKSNNPAVIFFNTTGTKFELYPLQNLIEDMNKDFQLKVNDGFAGFTLDYNVKAKDEVDKIIDKARKVGAKILKDPVDVFWEVAWGPNFDYDKDGMLVF